MKVSYTQHCGVKAAKDEVPTFMVVTQVVLCRRLLLLPLIETTYCSHEKHGVKHYPVLKFIAFSSNKASLVECTCCPPPSEEQTDLNLHPRPQ